MAIKKGTIDIVKQLLDHGADVNSTDQVSQKYLIDINLKNSVMLMKKVAKNISNLIHFPLMQTNVTRMVYLPCFWLSKKEIKTWLQYY